PRPRLPRTGRRRAGRWRRGGGPRGAADRPVLGRRAAEGPRAHPAAHAGPRRRRPGGHAALALVQAPVPGLALRPSRGGGRPVGGAAPAGLARKHGRAPRIV
ncbi:MAG: hypothetical protein AVDCRST_MAG89-3266, partial [uncultured Gemmatimonadetes bacterium]